jgi:RimJ/RimL family protein N-acetyltransferase
VAELGAITLEGKQVRLEPLHPDHAEGLLKAGAAPEIWPWMSATLMSAAAVAAFIEIAMRAAAHGQEYAFAVVLKESGRVVGSTRYMDVQAASRGAEIGWTWYAPDVWATSTNPECKFLLLQHAFETWGALRVQLKTDHMNTRSQAAIRKLGAQYEGTLRNHRIRPDGTVRDTVMFSVIDREWPDVKAGLLRRLGW